MMANEKAEYRAEKAAISTATNENKESKNTPPISIHPCGGCNVRESSYCKRCLKWRAYYLHRQDLINAYAEKLSRYWIYRLPLRRIEQRR